MGRGKTQLGGVIGGHRRKDSLNQQPLGQLFARRAGVEQGDAAQHFEPGGGQTHIAATGLGDDHLRNKQVEIAAALFPPFLRRLLIREQPHV